MVAVHWKYTHKHWQTEQTLMHSLSREYVIPQSANLHPHLIYFGMAHGNIAIQHWITYVITTSSESIWAPAPLNNTRCHATLFRFIHCILLPIWCEHKNILYISFVLELSTPEILCVFKMYITFLHSAPAGIPWLDTLSLSISLCLTNLSTSKFAHAHEWIIIYICSGRS